MNTYQYTAKDRFGQNRSGIIDAASESEVAELLHRQDLIIVSIRGTKKKIITAIDKKVKLDELAIFARQLATMLDAGVSLVQALTILSEQIENTAFRNVVVEVRKDIENGMGFCEALAKHPAVFSGLFINMAKAGEAAGMLAEVLERLATYFEKTSVLRRKIRSSLIYPAVIVTMAIAITTFLLVYVVPTFKKIFESLGGQLPLPTRILIETSDILRRYIALVVILLIILGFIFRQYKNTEKGRFKYDSWKLRIPVLGNLFHKVVLARFARTFSTLVKSGVTIINALDIVAKASDNKILEKAIIESCAAVREGESICEPLAKSGIFPPMACRMIAIGEQTGQLEKMLSKIADFYEEQVDAAVAALTSMIEPLVIAFLGVVIGGIVVSLFLPIFKVTQLMGH
jgi:type IV pilus assembly protein PilC